jgi:hypothetical protein
MVRRCLAGNQAPAQRGIIVYMTRRVLAFQIVLFLLGAFFPPAAPTLICRMTGQPMTPTGAMGATRPSCCAVAVTIGADGEHYTLTRPGCCDLRFAARHQAPAGTSPVPSDLLAQTAWMPVLPALPTPVAEAVSSIPEPNRQDAPRAPPRCSAPPRAPPTLS